MQYVGSSDVFYVFSDPGVGDFFLMENLDHLDICKPRSRSSVLYHMTEEFIRVCVERPGTPRQWGRHSTALGEAAMTETSMWLTIMVHLGLFVCGIHQTTLG